MKRSTALILFAVFDLFAVFMIYYFIFRPLNDIFGAITNRAASIEYSTTFYLIFGCVVIPVVHIIGLIETYQPRYFNRAICTGIIYGSIIVPLLLGISTAAMVKRAILHHGYFHCEGADTHMKLAHFKVYVREMDTCRQLTLERKKRIY